MQSINEALTAIAIGMKNDPHFESKLIKKVYPRSISWNVLNETRKEIIYRYERNFLKKLIEIIFL